MVDLYVIVLYTTNRGEAAVLGKIQLMFFGAVTFESEAGGTLQFSCFFLIYVL